MSNAWQKCPVCDGSGGGYGALGHHQCGCCMGWGIISVITGRPPEGNKYTSAASTKVLTTCNGDIDANGRCTKCGQVGMSFQNKCTKLA